MKKTKLGIIAILLLMLVGFAAVSTTLVMNGTTIFGTNTDDFDVIFTKSVIDGVDVSDMTISEDGKSLTFSTGDLAIKDDTSVLNFVVTNNSTQYDAKVTMECTTDGENAAEYYTITNTMPDVISAKSIANGNVMVKLKKTSVDNITETFTCTINANAVEKTDLVQENIVRVLFGDKDTIGSEVAIGNQEFYIISSTTDSISMLAKYNLNVGNMCTAYGVCTELENNTGIQDKNMIGYPADAGYPRYGTVAFSNVGNDYNGSLVEEYVNDYVNYLNSEYNLTVTGTLITKEEFNHVLASSSIIDPESWLFAVSYWTRSTEENGQVWNVSADKVFDTNGYDGFSSYGVRPVITISKDVLE